MGFGSWFKGSEPVTIEPVGTRSALENHLDTLLAEANVEESVDVVRFLLKKGAQPPNGARTDADTPDLAKERGFAWVDMIDAATGTQDAQAKADLLIKKSGYNGVVPGEWVNYAIDNEKVGALKVFLGKGSEYYRPNAHQVDHLHFALDRPKPNMEILKLLLDTSLEDVNKIPKGNSKYAGEAPIHVATRNKSPEAISLLREYGANVDIKGKKKRQTVRCYAHWQIVNQPVICVCYHHPSATITLFACAVC